MERQIEAAVVRAGHAPGRRSEWHRALEIGIERGFVFTYLREPGAAREQIAREVAGAPQWRRTRLAAMLARDAAPPEPTATPIIVEALSSKEQAVLQQLPSHLTAVEIAKAMFVSTNTVRTHIKAIYRKLGVTSRRDAVARAEQHGLLPRR